VLLIRMQCVHKCPAYLRQLNDWTCGVGFGFWEWLEGHIGYFFTHFVS
jgi:hypothetical protein